MCNVLFLHWIRKSPLNSQHGGHLRGLVDKFREKAEEFQI